MHQTKSIDVGNARLSDVTVLHTGRHTGRPVGDADCLWRVVRRIPVHVSTPLSHEDHATISRRRHWNDLYSLPLDGVGLPSHSPVDKGRPVSRGRFLSIFYLFFYLSGVLFTAFPVVLFSSFRRKRRKQKKMEEQKKRNNEKGWNGERQTIHVEVYFSIFFYSEFHSPFFFLLFFLRFFIRSFSCLFYC